MNRDQWTLKMKREELRLVQSGAAIGGSVKKSIFDRRAGSHDRRAAKVDRRAAISRQASSPKATKVRPADKYGACCEWGLPVRAQKQ
jgi:hypothetical protein